MDVRKVYSAEGAFCLAGLFFIALAFAFDLGQHLVFAGEEPGHVHGGGDVLLRVNIPVIGIAFLAFGLGMYIVNEHRDRVHLLAFVAGLLILTDGVVHLFAVSDHINVPQQVAFFGVLAPVQIGAGILFPFLPRAWDRQWILLTFVLIAIYAVSRRIAVPGLWAVEPTESLGVFSKAVEVLSLFPLFALVRREKAVPARVSAPGAAEP